MCGSWKFHVNLGFTFDVNFYDPRSLDCVKHFASINKVHVLRMI